MGKEGSERLVVHSNEHVAEKCLDFYLKYIVWSSDFSIAFIVKVGKAPTSTSPRQVDRLTGQPPLELCLLMLHRHGYVVNRLKTG